MMYFLLLYNVIRFGYLNLLKKNFNSSVVQRINPTVTIKLINSGKISLGRNLDIARNCTLIATNNGQIIIGEKVYMNQNCSISSKSKITIGNNCNFGPNVCVYDNNHKFNAQSGVSTTEYSTGDINIGAGTWIASNVIILKNSNIGKNCVIGAGCIIKGNIPDATLVYMDIEQVQKPIF